MSYKRVSPKGYEEMRLRLETYRNTVRKIERRSEEANRWRDLAAGTTRGIDCNSEHRPRDFGAAKTNELMIRQECEQLANLAMEQRARLVESIALVKSVRSRELLEGVYLNGQTVDQLASRLDRADKTIRQQLRAAVIHLSEDSDFFEQK